MNMEKERSQKRKQWQSKRKEHTHTNKNSEWSHTWDESRGEKVDKNKRKKTGREELKR